MNFCHTPQVALSIKYLNPFITLLLPTILIVFADVVSFALPLGGGERNSFKVTLVLSFTMFLIILNDELPGDSQCSPIIRQSARTHTHKTLKPCTRAASQSEPLTLTSVCAAGTHFCVCLILLVLSMLVSMVLTRLAKDGSIIFCCCTKGSVPGNKAEKEDEGEEYLSIKHNNACVESVLQYYSV